LFPCFINLPGWEAEEASGMDPDDWVIVAGEKRDLIIATRDYEKGDKSFSAVIQVGPSVAALYAEMEDGQFDSGGIHITIQKINGFKTYIDFKKDDESSTCDIKVVLFADKEFQGLLWFTSEGLTEKEALDIAQKFDWGLMRNKAESIKFSPFL